MQWQMPCLGSGPLNASSTEAVHLHNLEVDTPSTRMTLVENRKSHCVAADNGAAEVHYDRLRLNLLDY
jgi:hypothetical protein